MHRTKQFDFSAIFPTPVDIHPTGDQWWVSNGETSFKRSRGGGRTRIEDFDFWKPFTELLRRNGKIPVRKRGRPTRLLPPGTKFGCFSLTGHTERRPRSSLYYEARCDVCGRTKWRYVSNLRSLNKTCRCAKKPAERSIELPPTVLTKIEPAGLR
jgi:hypothetical protein